MEICDAVMMKAGMIPDNIASSGVTTHAELSGNLHPVEPASIEPSRASELVEATSAGLPGVLRPVGRASSAPSGDSEAIAFSATSSCFDPSAYGSTSVLDLDDDNDDDDDYTRSVRDLNYL